ncbi:MAG: TrkA family potassium uptake protein [Bacillota bacterium]|nr:TrkA family potassium uptake protein [Bacillota bacterium]
MKQFAVVGLGRFGASLARALAEAGHDVLGVDLLEERIRPLANVLTHVVQADVTDEEVLRSLGIRNFDVCVVTISSNIQSSILATLMIKEQGVPLVVAKARDDQHGKVLQKIGADRVVFPERDMGIRLAHNLVAGSVLDYIELSPDNSIAEVMAGDRLVGKNLRQLDLRARFGVNVMAVKKGSKINVSPKADDVVMEGDVLVVIGPNESIRRLEAR